MNTPADKTRPAFDWDDAKRRLRLLAEALDPSRQDSPQQQRSVLDARARALATPLESDEDESDAMELLTFRMGGELYAMETATILELTRLTTLTRVPDCPAFLRGITNLRGEVLAVVDLCALFELPGATEDRPWMLVLGAERAEFGIVIEEAVEVSTIHARDIFPAAVSLPNVQRELLRGVTEEATLVLNGDALLADQRLVIDET